MSGRVRLLTPPGRWQRPPGAFVFVAPVRAVLFVDGNNWYHGLKRIGVDAYDLDYRQVAAKLLMGRSLSGIRFYVGRITGDRTRITRQATKIAALEAQGMQITWGRVQKNLIHPGRNPALRKLREIVDANATRLPADVLSQLEELCNLPVPDYVEKQVDVAIAVDLVRMAFRDEYDVAYLLSADADYVSAVREAQRLNKTVFAAKARPERSDALGKVAKVIPLSKEWFVGLASDKTA